jgi:hypothetical protein
MSDVFPAGDAIVTVVTTDANGASFDEATGTTQIQLPDGEVEIIFGSPTPQKVETEHGDNLAELIPESDLSTLAERILDGIDRDLQSRGTWLTNMSNGISLLGLEIKQPQGASASGATPAEGVSTVDHPLLLEAVLRFQANARGELLPSDGPVKVRNDGTSNALTDELAQALEKDLNHYLTKTAKEYYPDTDRMLLMLGFSGISFKKGFHDPIKRRPVIVSINAEDLIVSNAATDIDNAGRITHRIMMKPSTLRRMQLLGAYRDIHLAPQSLPAQKDAVKTKIDLVQGIAPATYLEAEDADRELYETYCEIEVPGFEHTMKDDGGKESLTGLPLPYKVTIDREARRILEIRRNWDEEDTFCLPINRIIAYIFIPGLGFYGIGLLNVLGNATKAVTAAWRLMIDAGMFANFPGFLYLKSLAKQLTNQFRIPPGGGMPIDTVGNDIRSSVMPLPYKDPSAVFIQLIENIAQTAQRVGGTAETNVGEGKQDAPVGTTLALIEQATKLMSAVHKRLHQAQGQEFDMLKSLLQEDPAALWRHNKKKSKVLQCLIKMSGQAPLTDELQDDEERHRELFLVALDACELVPRADPNTSSQTERYLKVVAMRQMAMSNQSIDLNKVDERAFRTMGVDDPESLFKPPPPPGAQPPPSPEEVTAKATADAASARLIEAQTKAKTAQSDTALQQQELALKEKIASEGVAKELIIHNDDRADAHAAQGVQSQDAAAQRIHDLTMATAQRRADQQSAGADRQHELNQTGIAQGHEATQAGLDRAHDAALAAREHVAGVVTKGMEYRHEAGQNAADREQELATQPPPGPRGVAP